MGYSAMQKGPCPQTPALFAHIARKPSLYLNKKCRFPQTQLAEGFEPRPLITNQMLYQLSYASTAKPTEVITAAIELQAGLPARSTPIATLKFIITS